MKKSAQKIWRIVFANLPELPLYPWSNLCEPQYAALLFKRDCSHCAKATLTKADPYLLVRLCSSCRDTELLQVRASNMRTSLLYSLVRQTTRIKQNDVPTHPAFEPPVVKRFLRRDFEEVQNAWNVLSQPGNSQLFLKWKDEIHEEVTIRHQFAGRLETFLTFAEQERLDELSAIKGRLKDDLIQRLDALGHSAQAIDLQLENTPHWRAFEERPDTLTEKTWAEAVPFILTHISGERSELERLDREARRKEFHGLLRGILPQYRRQTHPLALIFQDLGLDLATIDAPEHAAIRERVAPFLDCYPFPSVSDIWTWDFMVDVHEGAVQPPEFEGWFQSHFETFRDRVHLWMLKFEGTLAARQVLGNDHSRPLGPDYDGPDCILKIRGSAELTQGLPLCRRILLRADSVFHQLPFDPVTDQDSAIFYPEFLPVTRIAGANNLDISGSSFYKHEEGVKVAKKLLSDLEMPDVSYLELLIMGNRFACGRCYFPKPTGWEGLVQHYLDESHAWNLIRSGAPRCKTEHPVQFIHIHNVDSQNPLPCARILPAEPAPEQTPTPTPPQDEEEFVMMVDNWPVMAMPEEEGWDPEDEVIEEDPEPIIEESIYCAPCKNYGRMFVTPIDMDKGMGWHLREVHNEPSPERGVHFELAEDSKSFLAAGDGWKDRWDAYHNARERSNSP